MPNKKQNEPVSVQTAVSSISDVSSVEKPFSSNLDSVQTDSISSIDRVNNSDQKEGKLFVSGVTRAKYMVVIAEALCAVKTVELVRADGSFYSAEVPDVARRQWACERSMELFGDKVTKVEQTFKNDLNDHDRKLLERLTGGTLKP